MSRAADHALPDVETLGDGPVAESMTSSNIPWILLDNGSIITFAGYLATHGDVSHRTGPTPAAIRV